MSTILDFSILKHFLCADCLGLFKMHFRHANEHKSAEKPSPTIFFKPCSDFSIDVLIMWLFDIFGSHFYSLFNDIILKMRSSQLSFNASTNKCITHEFVFVSSIKNSFLNFLNCHGGHLGFFHFKTFPLHGLCGTFLCILGMPMNINPLINLLRQFCWTLALCLPDYRKRPS